MAFDENLAARIRKALARKNGVEEKKMFGGVGFLLNGNMLVGVWKDSLIARIGVDQAGEAMLEQNVRPMDITGKPMKGWIMVVAEGVADEAAVKEWVKRAAKFVGALPAK
jgi:TfoX/Sxy family transcriptional regulator of competence genes